MSEPSKACLATSRLCLAILSIHAHEAAEQAAPFPARLVLCAASQQQSPREADAGLSVHSRKRSWVQVSAEVTLNVALVEVHLALAFLTGD
jgi:hypothetical protein